MYLFLDLYSNQFCFNNQRDLDRKTQKMVKKDSFDCNLPYDKKPWWLIPLIAGKLVTDVAVRFNQIT